MSFSADTQKWFDQNHTSRSTNPMSAPTAALDSAPWLHAGESVAAAAAGSALGFASGTLIAVALAMSESLKFPPLAASASFLRALCQFLFGPPFGAEFEHRARRLAARRQVGAQRSGRRRAFQISEHCAARIGGRSQEIKSCAGPNPNRCKASAASRFRSAVMIFSVMPKVARHQGALLLWQNLNLCEWDRVEFLTNCSLGSYRQIGSIGARARPPSPYEPCDAATRLVSIA